MNVKERWQYVYLHCSVFFFSLFSCLETLPIIGVYYAIKSAYTNEMMEPLWKQPSRGFESYLKKNVVAQGYTELPRQEWTESNYG